MRKLLANGLTLVVSLGMMAQGGGGTIPNPSFEQFNTVSVPVPADWEHSTESFKILYLDQYSYGIKQEQPGFSGNYGLRIEVPNNPVDTFFGLQIVTLPTLYTPAGLEFWSVSLRYKYSPNNIGDTATILILGFDDTLGVSAFGSIDIGANAATYTLATGQIFVGLSGFGYAQNVRHWLFVFSNVNPGCTLVVDSINIYDNGGNYYSLFPLNGDFENWYTPSVDTFRRWIVDAAFEHETIISPLGSLISTINGTLKAGTTGAPYGNTYAIIAPAKRTYISDTPYNALFQQFEATNNSPFNFQFAYKYTSNVGSDSASFLILLSDANSSNPAFLAIFPLPQTSGNWVNVSMPLDSLCPGCLIDTVLMAFIPQRVTIDTNGQLIGLPVDTAARLSVDMAVAGCVDTLPQAQFAYNTNNLTITVLDSSLYADSIVWDFGDGTVISGGDSVSHTYSAAGTYNVCQYAFNTCQQVDTICVAVSVTIVSASNPSISEDFRLVSRGDEYELITDMEIKQIQVVNSAGQILKNEQLATRSKTYKLDLGNLGKGVYFIKVTTIKGTDIIKVTVR